MSKRSIGQKLKKALTAVFAVLGIPAVKKQDVQRNESKKNKAAVVLLLGGILLALLVMFSAIWVRMSFGKVSIAAILFTLEFAQDGFTTGDIIEFLLKCVLPTVISGYVVCRLILISFSYKKATYKLGKKGEGVAFRFSRKIASIAGVFIIAACIITTLLVLPIIQHIMTLGVKSEIYDDYYVAPTSDILVFPEEKRNLIYIYLESMENTYADKQSGGAYDDNYIPNLTALAMSDESISFSNSDKLGGASVFSDGMEFTMASFVSQTAGVPISSASNVNKKNYKLDRMLPGIVTLEDILKEQGYNQMLLQGSTGKFAGTDLYYGRYDDTVFFPYESFISEGVVPEDYYEFWGVEDLKLYDYAKQELLRLSQEPEPFAFTLFTIDTHRPEGFFCPECEEEYSEQYANVISCADRQIAEFVSWLREQDFYENTTVIIVGDHPSMNEEFFEEIGDYKRNTYNCILNSAVEPVNTNNRLYSPIDMLPTTLAAMGVTVKGDRLGIGTNLFSEKPTLAEELGEEKLVSELNVKSDYYNEKFWLYEE